MYVNNSEKLLREPPDLARIDARPRGRLYNWNLRRLRRRWPEVDIRAMLGEADDGSLHRGSALFYLMPRLYGYMLSNDPERALPKLGMKIRRHLVHPLYLRFGRHFFEGMRQEIVRREPLPQDGRPLVFAPGHYFIQETLATVLLIEEPAYVLFGTLPHFFNTRYGLQAVGNGAVLLNRRDKASRHAVFAKAARLLQNGESLIIYPEGTWNKSPNRLIMPLWHGVFRIAKSSDAWIIPVLNLCVNGVIYSARLAPFDPRRYTEAAEAQALSDLRDAMATGLWLLMEQHAVMTREEFLHGCPTMHERARQIVAAQKRAGGYYYDSTTESGRQAMDLRLPNDPRPADVWRPVAELALTPQNVRTVLYARQIVAEDYQRL